MALPRLIFITGKGGAGKSTVAAATALALSRRRPTLLADVDQRHSAARLLGADLNGRDRVRIDERLEALALSPRAELEAFIDRLVPLRALARRMLRSRTFGYVTAALPGLEAFLMLERLRVLAGSAAREDRYLVIDGPATGTALELFTVARGVAELAPKGVLNRLALELERFLADPNRFGVVLALKPEELALREALEAAGRATELGMRRVAAMLNGVVRPLFSHSEAAAAKSLGGEHARLAARRLELAALAARARRRLADGGLPVMELPMLFRAVLDRNALLKLSQALEPALARQ